MATAAFEEGLAPDKPLHVRLRTAKHLIGFMHRERHAARARAERAEKEGLDRMSLPQLADLRTTLEGALAETETREAGGEGDDPGEEDPWTTGIFS